MKRISLIIAFVVLSLVSVSAQDGDRKEIKNRELEWSDFVGEIDATSRFDAVTKWVTTYSFPRPSFKDETARVKVTVRLFLRSTSWVKPNKQSARLLNHERGHFKIGKICARQIEDTINAMTFNRDEYARQIDAEYWKVIEKCKDFEKQYDSETNHYNNQEQQALWDKKLDEFLKP